MEEYTNNYDNDLRDMNPELYNRLYPAAKKMADHLRSVYPKDYRFTDKMLDDFAGSMLSQTDYSDSPAVMAASDPRGGIDSRRFARRLLAALLFALCCQVPKG